jgi:hypothetical protein
LVLVVAAGARGEENEPKLPRRFEQVVHRDLTVAVLSSSQKLCVYRSADDTSFEGLQLDGETRKHDPG